MPMNGFERRRKQKRDAILNTALELFRHHGVHKVSIAEIATSARVAPSTVYNLFNNKENLKRELVSLLVYEDYERSIHILEEYSSVATKLEKLLASKFDLFKNFTANFPLKYSEMNELLQELNTDDHYQDALLHLIEEGRREGTFLDSVTVQAMVTYFDIIRYYFIHNPEAILIFENNPEFAKEMYSLFLNGLLKK